MSSYEGLTPDMASAELARLEQQIVSGGPQANVLESLVERDRYVRNMRSMQIQLMKLIANVTTSGAGEARVEIGFPIIFTERPSFSYGGEMDVNQPLTAQSFPTVSAVVSEWITEGEMQKKYKGAWVAMVTTGPSTQKMIVHLHFEGKAFRNPVGDEQTLMVPTVAAENPTPPTIIHTNPC